MLRGTGGGGAAVSLSAKLEALSDVGSSEGVIVNTGASTAEVRAIGVGSSTAIPTVGHADSRFIRWFTSLPAGGVGADGDYGVLYTTGYPAVLILKTAGTWAVVDSSLTFAQILAIGSPATGMVVPCSSIDMGGDVGVRFVNTSMRYDGTYWKFLGPVVLDTLTGPTTGAAGTDTNDFNLRTMAPPAGLFHPGSKIMWDIMTYNNALGSGDTGRWSLKDNGAGGTTLANAGSDSGGKQHGVIWGHCDTANRLTFGGNTTASIDTQSSTTANVEVAADFNGSRTLNVTLNPVTGGTGKLWQLTMSHLVMFPNHTS